MTVDAVEADINTTTIVRSEDVTIMTATCIATEDHL